jgi:hypothetical protein
VQRTAALHLVARRAREVAEAYAALVLPDDEETGQLTVEVVDANEAAAVAGLTGVIVPAADAAFTDVVDAGSHAARSLWCGVGRQRSGATCRSRSAWTTR